MILIFGAEKQSDMQLDLGVSRSIRGPLPITPYYSFLYSFHPYLYPHPVPYVHIWSPYIHSDVFAFMDHVDGQQLITGQWPQDIDDSAHLCHPYH
jgi:hypothetical protein